MLPKIPRKQKVAENHFFLNTYHLRQVVRDGAVQPAEEKALGRAESGLSLSEGAVRKKGTDASVGSAVTGQRETVSNKKSGTGCPEVVAPHPCRQPRPGWRGCDGAVGALLSAGAALDDP